MTNKQEITWTEKLKAKWDLKNNTELYFVFFLYLATAVFCFFFLSKPILKSFGLQEILPAVLFYLLSAIATIPALLVVLLFLNYNKKLKEKWLLKSNLQFFIVIVLFSITGSSSVRVALPILNFLGIHQDTLAWYIYWPLRIIIVFPAYQLLFMIFGTLLGQWEFAWRFEKKMLSGFGRLFGIKNKKTEN
ncbi:MAG: diacylglyceryl transferase [Cytophagaceae bacterium]|jgi:hypothetical protein|nr:diacylglyceryl transferase [Cytophagaceae bacterium]